MATRKWLWLVGAVAALAAVAATGALGVSGSGKITTIAGTGVRGSSGDGGPATKAKLYDATGVAVDAKGNVYIADILSDRVRKVSPGGTITTFARVESAQNLAVDQKGNVYVSGSGGDGTVYKVSPGGKITNFAGGGSVPGGDGGPATAVGLDYVRGLAADSKGNVYIALGTGGFGRVRKVTPGGTITTIVGHGSFSGDGDRASQLLSASGVAIDRKGNLYIIDSSMSVRKVSPGGKITIFAGTGKAGFSGDGGPATKAKLQIPTGVAVDAKGNVYIADQDNNRVRKVSPGGRITSFAGTGYRLPPGPAFSGDGGPATKAHLLRPFGVAVDAKGNVYISDSGNNRVRKVRR